MCLCGDNHCHVYTSTKPMSICWPYPIQLWCCSSKPKGSNYLFGNYALLPFGMTVCNMQHNVCRSLKCHLPCEPHNLFLLISHGTPGHHCLRDFYYYAAVQSQNAVSAYITSRCRYSDGVIDMTTVWQQTTWYMKMSATFCTVCVNSHRAQLKNLCILKNTFICSIVSEIIWMTQFKNIIYLKKTLFHL